MRLTTLNPIKRGFFSCVFLLAGHAAFTQHTQQHRHYEFIPNLGQENPSVKYSVKLKGGSLFVENQSLLYHFIDNSFIQTAHEGKKPKDFIYKGHAYRMKWVNAQDPIYQEQEKTSHYYNYYLGKNSSSWKSGIHAAEKLSLKEIYPGITVSFETNGDERLEYTYHLAPGASPLQIIQEYEGTDQLQIARNGDLWISTNVGIITEQKPLAWQTIGGKKQVVPCNYKLVKNRVTYDFPKGYDASVELIIDPVLIFGSSSGSTADNFGMTATYDNTGHLYAGGTCFAAGYPVTTGAYDETYNGISEPGRTDVVISKYEPNGSYMEYATYLGGAVSSEIVTSLIVDGNDNLLLYGATGSSDFPITAGAFDNTFNGGDYMSFVANGTKFSSGTDIYVAKFNPTGTTLMASTFIGGSRNDGVNHNNDTVFIPSWGVWEYPLDSLQFNYGDQYRGEIQVDAAGNCYFASSSRSPDFPMSGGFDNTLGGQQDAVIVKLDPTFSTLMFSSFLGGSQNDAGYSLKFDASNNIYMTGGTSSTDFPTTTGTVYPAFQGGIADGYIAKIDPSGSSILAATYIGTNSYDQSFFVEVDKNNFVYLYGQTLGTTVFPIINVTYSNPNSGQFIVRLDNNLTTYDFSTLFGSGTNKVNISPAAFLVDVCGNIYISGWGGNIITGVATTGMHTTPDALQPLSGDGFNFYIACFQRNMSGFLYGSYYGGNLSREHVDGGTSRFDKYGVIYQSVCAGCGGHDDFPTTPGAWSNTNNSTNCNNGVFKFDFEIAPVADFTTDVFNGCAPFTVHFTNSSPPDLDYEWDFGNGDTSTVIYNPVITYPDTGTYTVTLVTEDSLCGLIDTAVKVITVHPVVDVQSIDDTVFCTGTILDIAANSNGTSPYFIWSSNGNFTDTLNAPLTDSVLNVNVTSDSSFYVQTYNAWCKVSDTVNVDIQDLDPVITSAVTSCAGDSATLTAVNATPGETYTIDWSPNSEILSGDGTNQIIVSPSDSVLYTVTFTSPYCTGSSDYEVYLTPGGIASVAAHADNDTITTGGSTGLHVIPGTGFTYSWSPVTGLSDPTSANPIATPTQTTTYVVTVSSGGCVRSDTLTIVVMDFVCGNPYIFVPDAFTPNGDGANDVMYVRGNNIDQLYFAIYERWGGRVFETTDKNFGWDGKVNGRDADPAVFDYYLKVTCTGGQTYFQKGNITLIR